MNVSGHDHDGDRYDGEVYDGATDADHTVPRDDALLSGGAGVLDGADARGGADPDDPAAEVLGLVFSAALAEEPPSRVTAESVLREVREAHRAEPSGGFAEWLRAAGWKWGGALAGAAALVGAVLVIGPMMGGGASGSAASGAADSAAAYSGAENGAAEQALPEMAAEPPSGAGVTAADEGAADGGAADAAADAAGGDVAGSAGSDSVPFAAADQVPEPSTGGTYKSQGTEQPEAPSQGVVLPPLSEAEWLAATGALPADVPVERWGQEQDIRGSALRSDMIRLGDVDRYLIVVAGPDTGPGRDYPGDTDPAITDTVGSTAERLRHIGLVTVQVADGTNRVAVAASEPALQLVTRADLTRIARAVLAAAH